MRLRRKPKGGVGSNQYQSRGRANRWPYIDIDTLDPAAEVDLIDQVKRDYSGPCRVRCGEVWSTECDSWVAAPGYAHGDHPTSESKMETAADTSTTKDILALLAQDLEWYVRLKVASNPETPEGTLTELSQDTGYWVRAGVAGNSSTPRSVLSQLALDPRSEVRLVVAHNRHTPIPVLALLTADPDTQTALQASHNPTLPDFIRELASVIKSPDKI